jgi:hypothetical protein
MNRYGGFLSHGGIPSDHPFLSMGFVPVFEPSSDKLRGYPNGKIPSMDDDLWKPLG